MDVAGNSASRPEDVLYDLAMGTENLGERMLRLAQSAAAVHRANILDLLADDPPASPASATDTAPQSDLNSAQAPARLQYGARENGSSRGYDLKVVPAIRRTEVA